MKLFRPQEPIRAALYFPLLRAWKEVEVGTGSGPAPSGNPPGSKRIRWVVYE